MKKGGRDEGHIRGPPHRDRLGLGAGPGPLGAAEPRRVEGGRGGSTRRRRRRSGWRGTPRGRRPRRAWRIRSPPRRSPWPTRTGTGSSSSPATSSASDAPFTRPRGRAGQGQVRAAAREPRPVRLAHPRRPHASVEPAEPEAGGVREDSKNNVDYTRELEDKLVDVVGAALAKMEPASLSYGVGRAHFALNRREPTAKGIKLGKNPAGPTDESVPILRVQDAGGKPLAVVFGYACHNTTLRPDMMKIDPDYAGYAQDRVEADNPGAMALFVTGCAGDADPHPFGTLDMAKEHGEELGEAVKFVLDHPAWLTPLTGPLRTAFTETTLHFAGPTDRASYEKLLDDPNPGRQRHARRMIEAIDRGRPIRKRVSPLLRAGLRPGRPVDAGRPLRRGGGRLRDPPPEGARRRGPGPLGGRLRQRRGRLHPLGPRPQGRRLRGGRVLLRQHLARPAGPRTSSRSSSRRPTRWSR